MIPPPPVNGSPKSVVTASKYIVVRARADLLVEGEVFLPGLWKQLKDEGVFEMFFHDHPELTFGQFVQALSNPAERLDVICEVAEDGVTITSLAALALLTQITVTPLLKRAIGNFLLFRKYWDHRESTVIGRVILDDWFKEFDVIGGMTPKLNRAALSFVHRMGFRSVGEVPEFCSYLGERCNAILTCMRKSEWETRSNG